MNFELNSVKKIEEKHASTRKKIRLISEKIRQRPEAPMAFFHCAAEQPPPQKEQDVTAALSAGIDASMEMSTE